MQQYDVIIIGGGVSGCALARKLSQYQLTVAVLDKDEDVCCGTTKANSAIVHAGFDAQPGSLMAHYNLLGSLMMEDLAAELQVAYKRIGALVICRSEEDRPHLEALLERGKTNGVSDLRIVEREELEQLEPHCAPEALCALYAPTSAIVNPFELCTHLASQAAQNGVAFHFMTEVTAIERTQDFWVLETTQDEFSASVVVNAAGVHADEIHNMVSHDPLQIIPRKGEYYVLDTSVNGYVNHTIFALPSTLGKGVLVTPTTSGNILVGPTATDIEDKEGVDTTPEGLRDIVEKMHLTMKDVPLRANIRVFAGLRAHAAHHDFVIGPVSEAPGFFDCAAIESPGLTSAPAIAETLTEQILAYLPDTQPKPSWNKDILAPRHMEHASPKEWEVAIDERREYADIVCRCRKVSRAQIDDALHMAVPATSFDGLKRRCEVGSGRCQGGFCTPKIVEILKEHSQANGLEEIRKAAPGSEFVCCSNKKTLEERDHE